MQRREALTKLGIISGAAFLATSGLLTACNFIDKTRSALTEKDIPLLDEIGETILPATASSPGAKEAGIGAFMLDRVNNCFNEKEQKFFIEGLNLLEANCDKLYNCPFLKLEDEQKTQYLLQLDNEANTSANNQNSSKEPYFLTLKKLVISGYFTSETGATKALRYDPVPGSYKGSIAYKKGDKPWATS